MPFDAVDGHEALLPEEPDFPIIVYCRSGKRAGLLKGELLDRGYTNVQVLPREQIFWEEDFMVFNCGTEPAAAGASTAASKSNIQSQQPEQ